jgi:putative hemolysin
MNERNLVGGVMKMYKSVVIGAATVLGLVGCSSNEASQPETVSKYDVNMYAVNKTICNPLGGSTTPVTTPSQGLQATLWYLQPGGTIYHDVESMINNGTQSDSNLFFSEIFVPTRLFSEGFPQQSGGSLQDNTGQTLIQYFALRFEGTLHLGPNEAEGDYQLGILSDDGSIWYLSQEADGLNFQPVLTNDGDTPTRLGCGQTIHMTKDSEIPMRLDYYQGPMYEIALVPLWRLVNSCTTTESLCGVSGNYTYFNPTSNSQPEPDYNTLIADGWYPLSSQNYSLLESASYNPCTTGTAPQITNLVAINDIEQGYYLVNWTTDIPATDQVLVTNTGTGTQTLTTSDNVLRTSHSVPVTALLPGIAYTLQAVSVSADLGKTISGPIAIDYQ